MVREVRSHMRHGAAKKKNKIKILKVLSYVPRLLAVTFSPSFQTRRLPGEGMCPPRVEGGLVPSFSAHTRCSTVAVFRVPPSRVLHRSPHPPLCLLRLTPRCRVREAAPQVGGGGIWEEWEWGDAWLKREVHGAERGSRAGRKVGQDGKGGAEASNIHLFQP